MALYHVHKSEPSVYFKITNDGQICCSCKMLNLRGPTSTSVMENLSELANLQGVCNVRYNNTVNKCGSILTRQSNCRKTEN
jgi:hypothetical protein